VPPRWTSLAVVALAGCSGYGTNSIDALLPPTPPGDDGCSTLEVDFAPLRRLTREQYDHLARDLVGDTSRPASGFLPDEKLGRFDANVVGGITDVIAREYMLGAEKLAATATLAPCDLATTDEETCATRFIETFGARAFRRPLAPEQVGLYLGLFQKKRASPASTFDDAARLVIEAMLQSPRFLYHLELGGPDAEGGIAKLTPHELASRLSFFLLGTGPSDELVAAAEAGELETPEQLERHARAMLLTLEAKGSARSFHRQWLGLDRLDQVQVDPQRFPQFDEALRSAMREETEAFVDHVLWSEGGSFQTLMTAPYSFIGNKLASLYEVPATGDVARRELDPARRAGVLTQAGVLAGHRGVVQRGKFIREELLCQPVPPPPPEVSTELPPFDANSTVRERFAVHEQDPVCGGCHRKIDPLGFAFLTYDELGGFQATENGKPIDSSGEVLDLTEQPLAFDDGVGLSQLLGTSLFVQACVSRQWLRFALAREIGEADRCSAKSVEQAFVGANLDVRELMVAVVKSDAFRYLKVER
jgi:hypothetical protein